MIVYYSILIYLLYLGVIKKLTEKYEKTESIVVIVAAGILFFFAAMRSINIGADTRQYCSHFLKIAQTKWRDFSTYSNGWYGGYGDIELGYMVYNKILSVFKNRQTIIIANSLLQVGLITIVIFRQSSDKWLSIYMYFSLCFFQTALNLTPSSIASYFMFLSLPLVKDKKLLPFLMFIVIGSLFHTSAVFFLPLYFVSRIKINKKVIFSLFVGGVAIIIFFPLFIKIISFVIPQKYVGYIDLSIKHKGTTIELAVLMVQLVLIAFSFRQCEPAQKKEMIKSNQIVEWMLIFEIILYLLSVESAMFQRGAFLFSPYVVIIVPNIINNIKSEKRKLLTVIAVVLYCTIMYILRVNVNNVGTTIPYEFFTDAN